MGLSPAQFARFAALLALALVFAATPAVADGASGPTPIGCVNIMLSQISDGLAVYAALSNVIGFGVASAEPGEGVEFAVMIVPSACSVAGLPPSDVGALMSTAQSSPTALPLP